jgi:hypothetical protein
VTVKVGSIVYRELFLCVAHCQAASRGGERRATCAGAAVCWLVGRFICTSSFETMRKVQRGVSCWAVCLVGLARQQAIHQCINAWQQAIHQCMASQACPSLLAIHQCMASQACPSLLAV